MTRSVACLVLALVTATDALAAPAATAPAPPAKAPAPPLPKPGPRVGDPKKEDSEAAKLPPFLGIFGSAGLLEKTGFRSAPGRYIEFDLLPSNSGGAKVGSMRLQEVGPALPGARWIELLATADGMPGVSGMRMLTRGNKDGNIERMIAASPNLPVMEFPLDGVTIDQLPGANPLSSGAPAEPATGPAGKKDTFAFGPPKKIGRETVEVPLGRFEVDHWSVTTGATVMEVWTTSDPKIPFTGAVKMTTSDGIAVASKAGTDAVAKIAVPGKAP